MIAHDRTVHPFAAFARKHLAFYAGSVGNTQSVETDGRFPMHPWATGAVPGYAFFGWQVENVQVFCTATTAAVTLLLDITGNGAIFAANPAPVAGTVVQATLVSSLIPRRGKFGDSLRLLTQTNGTGSVTNLLVTVTVRPFPLDNEAA